MRTECVVIQQSRPWFGHMPDWTGNRWLSLFLLVLCGESDPFLDECRFAAAALPSARLVVLEGCGHMPMLECPEAFIREVKAFLGEVSP